MQGYLWGEQILHDSSDGFGCPLFLPRCQQPGADHRKRGITGAEMEAKWSSQRRSVDCRGTGEICQKSRFMMIQPPCFCWQVCAAPSRLWLSEPMGWWRAAFFSSKRFTRQMPRRLATTTTTKKELYHQYCCLLLKKKKKKATIAAIWLYLGSRRRGPTPILHSSFHTFPASVCVGSTAALCLPGDQVWAAFVRDSRTQLFS